MTEQVASLEVIQKPQRLGSNNSNQRCCETFKHQRLWGKHKGRGILASDIGLLQRCW